MKGINKARITRIKAKDLNNRLILLKMENWEQANGIKPFLYLFITVAEQNMRLKTQYCPSFQLSDHLTSIYL